MAEFPIIEKLGGRHKVFARLEKRGLVRSIHALRMWTDKKRGTIPGDCLVEIMEMAERKRVKYRSRDFRIPPLPMMNGAGE